MTNPGEGQGIFRQRALDAYEKYMHLQAQIDKLEALAVKDYGTVPLAEYQLKHSERFAGYRQMCNGRDMAMRVASLNAQMALL